MKSFFKISSFFIFFVLLASSHAHAELKLTKLDGTATVLREGKELTAEPNMELKQWDKIKTVSGATVDFGWNKSKAGIRVLPESIVTIQEDSNEKMQIEIEIGNILANLREKLKPTTSFEVITPTAVAAVRGTQFWGRVQNQAAPVTTFAVKEGRVELTVRESGKKFQLEQGQALDVSRLNVNLAVVRPALPVEMQAMQQAEEISIS